jgi:methyltransferase-like protein
MTTIDFKKQKNRYVTREVDNELVLVPIESNVASMNQLFTMNSVGCFIWKCLDGVKTEADIIQLIVDEFDVEPETAKSDLQDFLTDLQKL